MVISAGDGVEGAKIGPERPRRDEGVDRNLQAVEVKSQTVGGSAKAEVGAILQREALQDEVETRNKVFGVCGALCLGNKALANFFTNIVMWAEDIDPEDYSKGSFLADVKAHKEELEAKGVNLKNRIIAHRLNTVPKIREAFERKENRLELDVRGVSGTALMSHDILEDAGEERSFSKALDLLEEFPDGEFVVELKDLKGAEAVAKALKGRSQSVRDRCSFLSFNPVALNFINTAVKSNSPIFFVPMSMSAIPGGGGLASLLGQTGATAMADVVETFYPGDLFGDKAQFVVNNNWAEISALKEKDEIFCVYDGMPPDDVIEALREGNPNRRVVVAVNQAVLTDDIKKWVAERRSRNIELHIGGVNDVAEMSDYLANTDATIGSDNSEEFDRVYDEVG